MGRKKIVLEEAKFEDNQTLLQKLSKMFTTDSLINNFSEQNFEEYNKIISHKCVQLVLKDRALMQTISSFFNNNLNTSITSDKTFMHRNTLNYRLEKIRRYTGLNLKLFEHAHLFRNLIVVYRILYQNQDTNQINIKRKRKTPPKEEINPVFFE